jgi:hypothetical protein
MKIWILVLGGIFVTHFSSAQILKEANKFLKQKTGQLNEKDAADGIRQALVKGTEKAVSLVSVENGYFANPDIKIPFPEDAKPVETKLRAIGLGHQVDEVIRSLNRAAEDAGKEATPIFVSAIRNMTVTDAITIVRGNNDAATQYLRKTSSPELTAKFQPVIKNSLDKVQATKYWEDLIKAYNRLPMVKKMNPDLTAYVTAKAIDGLFIMVAREEYKIRKDPKARTTELLRKVFGH